jgi:tetratricopeptide (TPR) repeat protein
MLELEARIAGFEARAPILTVGERAAWIDAALLRGHLRGSVADAEAAAARADALVGDRPGDGAALLVRSRTRALFHCFGAALDDLNAAALGGADGARVDEGRAAILEATGRLDEALPIREAAVRRLPSLSTLAALAALHAARRDFERAEALFAESGARQGEGSPIPRAWVDFQRGLAWLARGDHRRAQSWFAAALQRLPGYAPAAGQLAEIEAALGDVEAAIARLRPLAQGCDDPDYAARLARVLEGAGQADEAGAWRERAARRYRELVSAHAEAFTYRAAALERSSSGQISSQGSPAAGGAERVPGPSRQAGPQPTST